MYVNYTKISTKLRMTGEKKVQMTPTVNYKRPTLFNVLRNTNITDLKHSPTLSLPINPYIRYLHLLSTAIILLSLYSAFQRC